LELAHRWTPWKRFRTLSHCRSNRPGVGRSRCSKRAIRQYLELVRPTNGHGVAPVVYTLPSDTELAGQLGSGPEVLNGFFCSHVSDGKAYLTGESSAEMP
jgi:hypothetical protein